MLAPCPRAFCAACLPLADDILGLLHCRFRLGESSGVGAEGKGHSNGIADMAVAGQSLVTVGLDDSLRVVGLADFKYTGEVGPGRLNAKHVHDKRYRRNTCAALSRI